MYGSAAVAGASLLGIGALGYYGLGLSKEGQSILMQSGLVTFHAQMAFFLNFTYFYSNMKWSKTSRSFIFFFSKIFEKTA